MPYRQDDKWPPPLKKRFPGFTAGRSGWVRNHKGRTVACGGRRATREEVEATWEAKRKAIDAEADGTPLEDSRRTYREALAEFLTVQKARIGAPRNRIEERTYHNYVVALNAFGMFIYDGRKVADRDIRDVGPGIFSAYARTFANWKASGFDSVVTRVGALFHWAQGQEYIDRYRPGPEFVRPAKQDIRDQRIMLAKSYSPTEVAKLWNATKPGSFMRCAVGLGICAAFNNSDLGHVTRDVLDLTTGVIDFRRRKTGKVRRVIPLPAEVLAELKAYRRPEPALPEWSDRFFLTVKGMPYTRTRSRGGGFKPSDSVSRLFRELRIDAGAAEVRGRNYGGLRTSFFNLCPRGYDVERAVVMGRARGSVDLDHYAEGVPLTRLEEAISHVWNAVLAAR